MATVWTRLHFHDVKKLLEVLHELVDQGNSVVVIEHNLEVIKTADHVIVFCLSTKVIKKVEQLFQVAASFL